MIDLALLREQPDTIIALIKKKEPLYDGQLLYTLDKKLRTVRSEVEQLRKQKNELAQAAKTGITPEIRSQSIHVGTQLKQLEHELGELEQSFHDHYLRCPNIPEASLPEGNKESNKVIKSIGTKPHFNFEIKNHVQLGTQLGWFNFEMAATMSARNFVFYQKEAVSLLYALTLFMIKNNKEFGYQTVLPPYLVNEQSLENASNFPKFRDQVYQTNDNLYLIPTAEVPLANMYRDTIFAAEQLPLRYTAWTSCFRREAGTYGSAERGLIRIHQFEKVELYTYCVPEESNNELEKMLACAENILQQLGLHYQISLLAAQDCSFPSAKTYDIEVWMPGQNAYYEVSSCSNCTDFQARRGLMRYKKSQADKTHFIHTLNGSSLAIPRLMVAIMETYQQEDGTIVIPPVLQPYMIF